MVRWVEGISQSNKLNCSFPACFNLAEGMFIKVYITFRIVINRSIELARLLLIRALESQWNLVHTYVSYCCTLLKSRIGLLYRVVTITYSCYRNNDRMRLQEYKACGMLMVAFLWFLLCLFILCRRLFSNNCVELLFFQVSLRFLNHFAYHIFLENLLRIVPKYDKCL